MNYFETKIKYDRNHPKTGKEQTVTEAFLVDALSYTEAEERITKEANQFVSGEFLVKSISRSNIEETHMGDFDMNFEFVIGFVDVDEAGKEKVSRGRILINADSVQAAKDRVDELFKNTIIPWRILSVKESKIIEVFKYLEEKEEA